MDCKIDIRGIGTGEYNYKFSVDTSFFDSFESDLIVGAELEVDFLVTKAVDSDWMKVRCSIKGVVEVECDRCLSRLIFPVDIDKILTVNFSSAHEQEDEYGDDMMVLDGNTTEIDMGQTIYDYVCLSLPLKKVHAQGECDPDMIEKMNKINNIE